MKTPLPDFLFLCEFNFNGCITFDYWNLINKCIQLSPFLFVFVSTDTIKVTTNKRVIILFHLRIRTYCTCTCRDNNLFLINKHLDNIILNSVTLVKSNSKISWERTYFTCLEYTVFIYIVVSCKQFILIFEQSESSIYM